MLYKSLSRAGNQQYLNNRLEVRAYCYIPFSCPSPTGQLFEVNMSFLSRGWVLSWALLLLVYSSSAFGKTKNNEKSAVFLSPMFELGPGAVANKHFTAEFPRGHIAVKSFNVEVVDEAGNSVSLQQTYLHHCTVIRYHHLKNVTDKTDIVVLRNSGLCQFYSLDYYFGFGSETRGTSSHIPDPFGIEVGNPEEIPKGYEEKWLINYHAIDTRGVAERLGCVECRCDLYNITTDGHGKPLSPDYGGGMLCCPDETECRLRKGFLGPKRKLYLKYTVKWVEWDSFVVPVKVYVLDVTDTLNKSKGLSLQHNCKVSFLLQIEYDVKPWSKGHANGSGYLDVKRASLPMPTGGYVIYGVGHLHIGGTGSTLYGQDGRVICSSLPRYGTGKKVGNEKGYLVAMSTCYPWPGSGNINDGETLTLEITYNNSIGHTGVMGLFYILVAEKLPHHDL
ncbi:uncharacterized protein LOC130732699 [Lotus japonicus]|uniref:uncharacterized protein LOC130732699 n=1 Tax=Lotus japonicus TaxID=34305 RepID=UPI002582D885|nr:uncharacterized protein LOC130732699 [Lotus japonicus]